MFSQKTYCSLCKKKEQDFGEKLSLNHFSLLDFISELACALKTQTDNLCSQVVRSVFYLTKENKILCKLHCTNAHLLLLIPHHHQHRIMIRRQPCFVFNK